MGEQAALLVKDELLGRQPAHALDKAAFDLADIDGGIYGAPDIMEDIHAPDVHFAGEDVDQDFATRRTVGIVKERPTFALFAIPMQLWRLVNPAADKCTRPA